MKKIGCVALALLLGSLLTYAETDVHRFGAGANYWVAVDDVEVDNIDDNGLSYFLSYQYRPSLIGLQLDMEIMPDMYAGDAYAPAAYVVVGGWLYAALGVGIVNYDGDWEEDPFFALKAGLDLELLPSVYLDLGVSYRVESTVDLDDAVDNIDTDTIFLGAAARFGF